MADAEATVLLKVKADSSQAVKDTDKFTESQKRLGHAVDANADKVSKLANAGKSAWSGIGSALQGLNQGLEVIDKVIRTVDKAVDSQLVEKAKGFGLQVKNAADATEQFHKALAKNPAAFDDTTRGLLKTREAMDDFGKSTQKLVAEIVVPAINLAVDAMNDLIEYGADFIDLITRGELTRQRLRKQADDEARLQISGQGFRNDVNNASIRSSELGIARNASNPGYPSWKWYGGQGVAGDDSYASALIDSASGNSRAVAPSIVVPRGKSRGGIPVVVVGVETGGGQVGGVFSEGRGIEGSIGGRYAYDVYGNPVDPLSTSGLSFGGSGLHGLGGLVGNDVGSFVGNKDLAGMTDPLAKLKERLGDTTSTAGAAYATLAGGITAAVDAAITGSDSIGRAAAKASAGVLKSLAVESTGRAVYEGALAIGSLAIQDYRGAAAHGLAAAKFAAAAAVTGSLAAGLGAVASGGGGGGGASAGAPAGGFGQATGGSSSSGPINVTINIGAGFSGDARVIQEAARRGVREAQLRGGRGNYATSVEG